MKILLSFVNTQEEVNVKHIVLKNKATHDKLVLAFKKNTVKFSKHYRDCEIELDELDVDNSILPSKDIIESFNDNAKANNYLSDCYIEDIVLDSGYNDDLDINYIHIQVNNMFTNNVLYRNKLNITKNSVPVTDVQTEDNKIFVICSDKAVYSNRQAEHEPVVDTVNSRANRRRSKLGLLGSLCSKVKEIASSVKKNVKSKPAYNCYSSETLFLSRMALINR